MNITNLSVEEVIENYAPIVKKQMKKLNIYKDYDDYYQIGLIALWEAYVRFDPSKGSFATFAILTVRGRLLSLLQKEQTFSQQHHITDVGFDGIVDEQSSVPLEAEMVESYLDGLSPRQQTWIKERILNNKTTAEIAKEYNVQSDTVRMWKKELAKNRRLREKLVSGSCEK